MKFLVIIAFALIVGIAISAQGDPSLRRGQELIDWIEGDLTGTFIVMFYDSAAPTARTDAMREQIKRDLLREHEDFHYYEVDVLNEDYKEVVALCEINLKETKHSPTIMAASDGNGYWAHGQGAVEDVKYQLPYVTYN